MARSILFVDVRVQDYQKLLAGLPDETEVFLLDPFQDGIGQMADYLARDLAGLTQAGYRLAEVRLV